MDVTLSALAAVGAAFGLPGAPVAAEEIAMGNINRTFKVTWRTPAGERDVLFQRINTFVFRDAEALMTNVDRVTAHLRAKRLAAVNLCYEHTAAGTPFWRDGGAFWRVCNFIPSVTFMTGEDAMVVRGAGEAFGDFQRALADFDPALLTETIPGFHDTRARYAALRQSIAGDPAGRAAEVGEEIAFLLSIEDDACLLTDARKRGDLPLRVTHNDTKLNNVLFDSVTRAPLAVIDLDTVMPGLVGCDFGDAVRFAANVAPEDAPADRVRLDMTRFEAFADGFLSRTAAVLTPLERETLASSCLCMTAELAVRFLTDYLDGDRYFKVCDPAHNLRRARNQIALAGEMLARRGEMETAVARLTDCC